MGISEIKYFCYKIGIIFKKIQERREKNKIKLFFTKKIENEDIDNSGKEDQIVFDNIKQNKLTKKLFMMKIFFNKLIYKKNNPELYLL